MDCRHLKPRLSDRPSCCVPCTRANPLHCEGDQYCSYAFEVHGQEYSRRNTEVLPKSPIKETSQDTASKSKSKSMGMPLFVVVEYECRDIPWSDWHPAEDEEDVSSRGDGTAGLCWTRLAYCGRCTPYSSRTGYASASWHGRVAVVSEESRARNGIRTYICCHESQGRAQTGDQRKALFVHTIP